MTTWKYVMKTDFVEQYGDKVSGQFVALMMRVGSIAFPGDVDGAKEQLIEGLQQLAVQLPPAEITSIAENLTAPENDILLVCENHGTVIAEHRLRRAVVAA